MSDKYLHNGIKLLKKRDFLEAINNLEEYITYDNTNYLGYYYLGLAYIFRELYDEAYKYISKAYKLNENDVNTINTLAFLNLKFNNVDEAINYWLDALDIDKKNYIAKRNLDKVKSSKNIKKLVNSASGDEFINFKVKKTIELPFKIPHLFDSIKINYIGLIIFIAVIGIIFLLTRIDFNKFKIKKGLSGDDVKNLTKISLPNLDRDYMIDKTITKSIFNLKPEEVRELFYKTKLLIQKQHLNEAAVIINKVLHSNAGLIIKEKFKILKQFISPQQTFELPDNVVYSDLMNLPLIYEDVQVIWEGKMEDIRIDDEESSTVFNLFVKEHGQTIGVARVIFTRLITTLTNGKDVIVSGRFIKVDQTSRNPVIEGLHLK
ncbi:MAG: hypothetical protein KKH98_14695 [Spirochaetes bacterium]|nr:hypothetical protein [Spirochaetota bacterium]